MKYAFVLASLLLLVAPLSAQYYSVGTTFAYALPSMGGELLQYSFPLSIGFWIPWQQSAKYKFGNNPNTAEIITLKSTGASELLLLNNSDICKEGCSYDGFFTTWNAQPQIESVVMPDGSIGTRVSGTLTGTFTIGSKSYSNVTARLYFETYPSRYQDNSSQIADSDIPQCSIRNRRDSHAFDAAASHIRAKSVPVTSKLLATKCD